jgi:hypothetical protein
MSVRSYQYSLRNSAEECRSHSSTSRRKHEIARLGLICFRASSLFLAVRSRQHRDSSTFVLRVSYFNAPFHFTPLVYSGPLVFGLTPFGLLRLGHCRPCTKLTAVYKSQRLCAVTANCVSNCALAI